MSHRLDPYEVLGIPRSASQDQVRAAYRRLVRRWHPDANRHSLEAERTIKRLNRAYELLGDAARRAAHDQRRARATFAGPSGAQPQSYAVDDGPLYHEDLGHHSDFYQAGDPLSVADAASLTGRHPEVIRRAIRRGQLTASREGQAYLLRRRDVERWHRAARMRSAVS